MNHWKELCFQYGSVFFGMRNELPSIRIVFVVFSSVRAGKLFLPNDKSLARIVSSGRLVLFLQTIILAAFNGGIFFSWIKSWMPTPINPRGIFILASPERG